MHSISATAGAGGAGAVNLNRHGVAVHATRFTRRQPQRSARCVLRLASRTGKASVKSLADEDDLSGSLALRRVAEHRAPASRGSSAFDTRKNIARAPASIAVCRSYPRRAWKSRSGDVRLDADPAIESRCPSCCLELCCVLSAMLVCEGRQVSLVKAGLLLFFGKDDDRPAKGLRTNIIAAIARRDGVFCRLHSRLAN